MTSHRKRVLSIFLGVTIVLSGCNPSHSLKQPPDPIVKQEDIQSVMERQMVILFQSLIQMDKKDGLTLSRKQAEEMLPVVRHNSSEGELSQTDQQRIVGLLTMDQRSYLNEFQERIVKNKQFLEKKPLEELTPEQREQMIQEFQSRRMQRDEEDQSSSILHSEEGSLPSGSWTGGQDNVEQQLIDLLESKLRKHLTNGK